MRERDSGDSFRSSLGFGHGHVAEKRRPIGRNVVVGACVALLLTTAACSSNDAPTTATSPESTDGSTTSPDRTAPPTSDTPPTTPASADAPTTTLTPDAQADADVREASELGDKVFSECLEALPSCDVGTLAVARTDPLLERNRSTVEEWNGLGLELRNPEGWVWRIEMVELADDLDEATVTVCWNDTRWLVYPAAGPDGQDVVFGEGGENAPPTSARDTMKLRLIDGKWMTYDAANVEQSTEVDLCASA